MVAAILHPRGLSGFTPRNEAEPRAQVVVLDVLPGEAGARVRNGSCLQRNYITTNLYRCLGQNVRKGSAADLGRRGPEEGGILLGHRLRED